MSNILTTGFVARVMTEHGYLVIPGTNRPISGGASDSRLVRSGNLFAAFRGESLDGNDFVEQAIQAGASAVICEKQATEVPSDVTVITVPDTRAGIKDLAHAWRSTSNARVIGITGTVGKTTAKEAVAATLGVKHRVHRSAGNMNSREGLPLALLTLRKDDEISVLEMAMDSKGEILELCQVAAPSIGVVLNIGLTHVSRLGSPDAIAREKLSLPRFLPNSGTAILNAKDPAVDSVAKELRCRVIRFGSQDSGASLIYSDLEDCGLGGYSFSVSFEGAGPVRATANITGVHTLPAALTAIASAISVDMSLEEAVEALAEAKVPGRMQSRPTNMGATLLDDSYNSSPASLVGALATLDRVVSRGGRGRRIAVIGPMTELGEFEEREHIAAGETAARTCDFLFAFGEPCRAMVETATGAGLTEAHWFSDRSAAALAAMAVINDGDVVLLKASRSQELETVIPLLMGEVAQ